jgi:hypothetical protein
MLDQLILWVAPILAMAAIVKPATALLGMHTEWLRNKTWRAVWRQIRTKLRKPDASPSFMDDESKA